MARSPVYGKVGDFAGNLDPSQRVRLVFTPNGAAVGANGIVHGGPIYVDEFIGQDREWSVSLEETTALERVTGGDAFYIVSIERRPDSGNGWFAIDQTGWQLRVPPGGGAFDVLVGGATNPAQVWFDAEPPTDPTAYTGWVKTNALPGEPNYFEWED